MKVAVHEIVLRAANQLARKPEWTFALADIVRALPELNQRTVRSHVTSRCCIDAPAHHAHRLPYFARVNRGTYRVLPQFRRALTAGRSAVPTRKRAATGRNVVHAAISRDGDIFTAECLEAAVVTEGHGLDAVVGNLREALALHFEDEDLASFGLVRPLRLEILFESPLNI